MNAEQVASTTDLLAYAASVDPRFNTTTADQAQARIVAWADVLDGVPADYALSFVRRYYRHPVEWPVTPGVIRDAWLTEQRRTTPPATTGAADVKTEDRSPTTRELLEDARAACRAAAARFA